MFDLKVKDLLDVQMFKQNQIGLANSFELDPCKINAYLRLTIILEIFEKCQFFHNIKGSVS